MGELKGNWKEYETEIQSREEFERKLEELLKGEGKGKEGVELVKQVSKMAHKGQKRKDGKGTEMIKHPYEVGGLIKENGGSKELEIAGYLHDTIEDTYMEYEDIVRLFGYEVAKLVESNTEDKSKSWEERKEHTIRQVSKNSDEENLLLISDKYSNLKESYEKKAEGIDNIWEGFKRGEDKQSWYFKGILNELRVRYDGRYPYKLFKKYDELVGKVFK